MIGYGRSAPFFPAVMPGLAQRIHPLRKSLAKAMDCRVKPGNDGWFAAAFACALRQHAHDVALLHDQEFLAVELDLGARPLAEQHAVADPEVDRDQLAAFIAAARADRRDFALRGLFLGGVGNDDAALGLFLGVETFDHDTVMQRTKFGFSHDGSFGGSVFRSGLRLESGSAPERQTSRYP